MLTMYSVNTFIAFSISEQYYRRTHYFWCSPTFDDKSAALSGVKLPPSSCPAEIYAGMRNAVVRGDRHSPLVAQNKSGILNGASVKLNSGQISQQDYDDITEIVKVAEIADFRPLLFVAPFSAIKNKCRKVPVSTRASPFSVEYIADGVHRHSFDILELP